MKKDYYDILEVSSDATQEEIKKAYRDKVRYWHPDRNKSEDAHERIVEINEAYETLGDPEERRFYDFYRANDTYSQQYEYETPRYEYPPYQPNPESFKQERLFSAEWGKVIFYGVLIVFALYRLSSTLNKKLPFEDATVIIKESNELSLATKHLIDQIDLENIKLDNTIASKEPYLALYAQYDTSLKFNRILTSELNGGYLPIPRKKDIKTIIVYEYVMSEQAVNDDIPYQDVRLYFINPSDLSIYKIKIYSNNSSAIIPSSYELRSFILKN